MTCSNFHFSRKQLLMFTTSWQGFPLCEKSIVHTNEGDAANEGCPSKKYFDTMEEILEKFFAWVYKFENIYMHNSDIKFRKSN